MLDAVVVGGGPAGLSAALWLGRYRQRTLVVDSGDYRNRWVDESHGYLGFDQLRPLDFIERARREALSYPFVSYEQDRILSASRAGEGFELRSETRDLSARRIVLATGVRDVFPSIQGFLDHYGAGVFHCPSCDGYETKGCAVAVIGYSEDTASFATQISRWASKVTLIAAGDEDPAADETRRTRMEEFGVDLLDDEPLEFVGPRGELRGIRLKQHGELACDVAFFGTPPHPANDLAQQLGCKLTDEGCVMIDHEGHTTRPGVFAAGDVAPGPQLIQTAAAQGCTAGIHCATSVDDRSADTPPDEAASPDPAKDWPSESAIRRQPQ